MANEPNDVRDAILRRLRSEQEKELQLVNNLLGDKNPIRTFGDYSKPSYEGYKNTIELPVGNNMVPLRSDTIQLVQNRYSFHELRFEDPNQHLKDFLKLVDSLDLVGENRERTRLRLFQFSLRDQASNWLEHLPAGSITTWEDLTTRPNPQPHALGTTFEARVRDYMAAHTKRMERFENAIFKQREEINDRMTEMFGLLKELTTSRTPEKVLTREEAKIPVTKNVNSISLEKGEEGRSEKINVATGDDIKRPTGTETGMQSNKGIKKDIEPIAPIMTVNMLFSEWEERIKLRLEMEMEFNRWKSKNFKGKHPTLVIVEGGMEDKKKSHKDVLYLTRKSLEVLRKFHWMILEGRFNQLSHVSSPLLSKPEEY
uniref:Zinc finger, CCHC-type n=1 Tax=Tanacetum cinerariifolium TaxID=118510 RepID=A0A6L2LSD9_TANCI|nr:zinc finger, CCHC-type [Tanacetum cinerariifolium]